MGNVNNTKLMQDIETLVSEELDRAVNKFGAFNSPHEGKSIIEEEIEESLDEIEEIKKHYNCLWQSIKLNNKKDQRTFVLMLMIDAERAVYELIQVAAMAKRYLEDIKENQINA